MDMAERKGFRKGIEAMRAHLVREVEGLGGGMVTGLELAQFLRTVEAPEPDEKQVKTAAE